MKNPDTAPLPSPELPERRSEDDASATQQGAVEIGGRNGPDPTRYGDWEKNGRCVDF
jgi:hypothetical protein